MRTETLRGTWPVLLPALLALGSRAPELRARDKPATAVVIRTSKSGSWSAPGTWEGGKVPGAGARVVVRRGHTILYDVKSDQAIRAVMVAGTLNFATDRDTRLDVGLIKIHDSEKYTEEGFDCDAHVQAPTAGKQRPALIVGTPDKPVDSRYTALIRLVYFTGMDKQSCPAIVCW